ncbi:MAG TPA: Hsp20/alpha crystallin family protein [Chitinophagaceae bacterium]|nr:Hsp20/alpha crystallin family protein [Chitinophagaceae bacterium]
MTTGIIKRNNGSSALPVRTLNGWVDQVIQNSLNRFFSDDFWGFTPGTQTVPVNLRETDKTYELELVAPGLKKEDLRLQVSGDLLTISFEQKERDETEENGWLRNEYRMQSFSRSFNLIDTVDVQKIEARYTDGILRVTLPKKESAQRINRNIEIR